MQLTRDQEIVCDRLNRDRQDAVVHGYAGTGKTTLFTSGHVRLDETLYLAVSNKACAVLAAKLRAIDPDREPNVQTVYAATHSGGTPWNHCTRCGRRMRDDDERRACQAAGHHVHSGFDQGEPGASERLTEARDVVVDEASMMSELQRSQLEELRTPGQRLIYTGDPMQLPPVGDTGMFDAMALRREAPIHEMTEITRQAEGSPIIRLAHDIRRGLVDLPLTAGPITRPDMVLCYTNKTRTRWNVQLRQELHGDADPRLPLFGEPLYVGAAERGAGYSKGDILRVIESQLVARGTEVYAIAPAGHNVLLLVDSKGFLDANNLSGLAPIRVDYAYAMTAHRAQGSEWGRVLFNVSDWRRPKDLGYRRWAYTSVTRAAKELVIK